jgi:hypothetical protein
MEKLYKFEGEKMTRPQPLFRLPFGFSLGLIAVMLVSACAPAIPTASAVPALGIPPAATQTPEMAAQPTVQDEAATPTAPVAVATSRGPDLEATDPATVSLASGGLQLVEFFRFT